MSRIPTLAILVAAAFAAGCSQSAEIVGNTCTPTAAMTMWQRAPDTVCILDVRTPAEFIFMGHAPMARNIPFKFLTNEWDAKNCKPAMALNPQFLDEVKKFYQPADTLLLMCASGKRGAGAVKLLRASGYTRAYNIEGGFDGQRGKDCSSRGAGKLIKSGWRTSRLVWTMSINPESLYLPGGRPTPALTAKADMPALADNQARRSLR